MADRNDQPPHAGHRHLDASGPEEVVFCHQCEHEWIRGPDGSLVCPVCEGEVTEIVNVNSDPRSIHEPPAPPSRSPFHDHNPWATEGDFPDPDEADIEEHITHGPGGATTFTRTTRFSNIRSGGGDGPGNSSNDPDHVLRDFQAMVGGMIGPGFRAGMPGRSGPETLFTQGPVGGTFRFASGGVGNTPQVTGTRITWTSSGNGQFRATSGQQMGPPQDLDLPGFLGGLFGAPVAGARGGGAAGNMPPGLLGLLAMMNPQNARSGDAVYTQEAMDSIISQLMEQHPTSNAPGPATPEDIARLQKKKLDFEMLGPEGKGECSVCMDDVHVGDEVVVLPCAHWFHEVCASAWLSEHNTCPICRKGINDPATNTSNGRSPGPTATPASQTEPHTHRSGISPTSSRRFGLGRSGSNRDTSDSSTSRNESRLNAIRNTSRQTSTHESSSSRWHFSGSSSDTSANDPTPSIPGAFQRRASEISENPTGSPRRNTSGSDRSRRNSQSGSNGNGAGTGSLAWFRDRFGSNRRTD